LFGLSIFAFGGPGDRISAIWLVVIVTLVLSRRKP
jgi:hypothetical protein